MTYRRSLPIALTAALALGAAACSASAEPGWTYAPVPSPTPVPSAAASPSEGASPSAAASPSPSGGEPSAAPSAAASAVTDETLVTVVAQGIKWTQASYGAPADEPFRLELDNQDAGIPHNVSIRDATNTELFKSAPDLTGIAKQTYDVSPIAAGTYKLICTLHPTMTAELTVGA